MPMPKVFRSFLEAQLADAEMLSLKSDIVQALPVADDDGPPRRFLLRFQAKCLVQTRDGRLSERMGFHIGVHFREQYLHHADSSVVEVLMPLNVYHPNVIGPIVCLGKLAHSEGLVSLSHQLYEIFTYQNFATHDGLNPDACQWARQPENQARFPLECRPLKRREPMPASP